MMMMMMATAKMFLVTIVGLLLIDNLEAFKFNDEFCGTHSVRIPKIVNGTTAPEGQYPFIVSILRNDNHHCGGSLIAPNWVLTAAHCVYRQSADRYHVKVGGYRRSQLYEPGSKIVKVGQIFAHDGFSFSTFADDIALLKLTESVTYSNVIRPICLPPPATMFSKKLVYEHATVIGWGKLRQGGQSADHLQELTLPIVRNDVCQSWYHDMGKSIFLRPTQLCAGVQEGGRDACQGDSGSPLLIKDPETNRTTIVGIVSAGIGCALPKLPGLYTRVTSFLDWLEDIIVKNDRSFTYPTTVKPPTTTTTTTESSTTTESTTATPPAKITISQHQPNRKKTPEITITPSARPTRRITRPPIWWSVPIAHNQHVPLKQH